MPSQLPSSFASAAAGQNRDARGVGGRGDATRGAGSGEWARRDGRSTNGTLTFRRSSTTPFNQSTQQSPSESLMNPAAEPMPASGNPQHAAAFDGPTSYRYSKDDLLEIFKSAPESAQIEVTNLFLAGWNPGQVNGSAARAWGKSSESSHVPQDPTVCWESGGTVRPIGLEEMSAEEKDLFAADVNSPLKLPQQTKDASQGAGGLNGRKTSVSHGSVSNYATSSPSTASRPGTRRRETTDTNPFPSGGLVSPTGTSRFSRDDPSTWFNRKSTDTKEPALEEPEEESPNPREIPAKNVPFGGPTRSNTSGGAGFAGAAAIWGNAGPASASSAGSFGNFALPTPTADKRFGGGRGESRLAHLIPKESSENIGSKPTDAPNPDVNRHWRPRPRTDTDPFGDDSLSGSAALGGGQDSGSPPLPSQPRRGPAFDTPVKGTTGDFGMSGLSIGGQTEGNGPASPSETNPYRSPPGEHGDDERDEGGLEKSHPAGIGSEQVSNFGTLPRTFGAAAFEGSDRSQTSSVGAKGYPALNNLTGWPAGPSAGTPDRERPGFANAFGGSLFSPVGDLQSPGISNLGGVFGAAGPSGITASGSLRGSKLGSLFPPAMQAQMQTQDQESLGDSVPDLRQSNPLGAIGRGAVGPQAQDANNPVRGGRGIFEDLFPPSESSRSPAAFTTGEQNQPGLTATTQSQAFPPTSAASAFPANTQTSSDPPPAQARTMVMPDRMRWVYLDPQGQIQGPFTGLEMNDWYKANFFTPDLRVKKIEDHEFEPLGQLIRRIGNSREPFLVPQIGIPHGPPSQAGPFSQGDSRGGVIPPLMGAFPSFGRTLTAEEQNNLERRKQEEQYLMARQREFLAQQQALSKMQQMQAMAGGVPGALHHHSSAHSLQSQPSFGSMTSPIGMPPQPPIGAIGPAFFEPPTSMAQSSAQPGAVAPADLFREDLNPQERQMLASLQGAGAMPAGFPVQAPAPPSAESSLRSQLPGVDQLQKDSQGFSARLKEFNELRAQRDAEEAARSTLPGVVEESSDHETMAAIPLPQEEAAEIIRQVTQVEVQESKRAVEQTQPLSLTQQVQKTQAAAAAAAAAAVAAAAAAAAAAKQVPVEAPWPKSGDSGLPMPFPPPPPQSATPLPAPTAQRGRSNLPEQYARSRSETPETSISQIQPAQPPPLAPWAREPGSESQKGPSLREIQEAEAKKAAKAEEAAAAIRRAALEQEAASIREREKASAAAAAASGLPTSSTWGGSPVGATHANSPWAKPGPAKTGAPGLPGPATSGTGKKTLADIQREEEARKQKAKELATQTGPASGTGMGKRYADLASKGSAPPGIPPPAGPTVQPAAAGWSTVGAGGKVKIPTGPAAQARVVSAGNVKSPMAPAPAAKPTSKPMPAAKDAGGAAMDEFNKWLHRELGRGITGGIDIDTFASTLLVLPPDQTIISEAVYANSTTMDGRHFAEEFIRRKKLADKGVVEKPPASAGPSGDAKAAGAGNNGGWSEVAKKGSNTGGNSHRDEGTIPGAAGFKVVPGRKKGRK